MKNSTYKNSSIQDAEVLNETKTTIEPFPQIGLDHPLQGAVVGETGAQMESRARQAALKKLPFIEADPDVIHSYVPAEEMGAANYIMLHNIRVSLPGVGAATLKKEAVDMHRKMHGESSFFEGRG